MKKNNRTTVLTQLCSTDTATQRNKILTHLKENGSATTFDFREKFGICAPAPRVFELRQKGVNVETHFVTAKDSANNEHHNIALYVLKSIAGGA